MARSTLILFVDAFAFDYLAKRPFLPGFWRVQVPLETLLGYSSSIVPALWSGLRPDQMGVWSEFFFQPRLPYRLPRALDHAPHPYLRNFLRRVLFRCARRYGWYRHSLPGIPAAIEHLFSRTRIQYRAFPPIPLGDAGLDVRFAKAGLPYRFWFSEHAFDASRALASLRGALDGTQVFVYATASLDLAGHIHGPDPVFLEAQFAQLETFITSAQQILARDEAPNVVLVSDHGMTPVIRHFDLVGWLKPWELGREYVAFLDSTMARFWDAGTVPLARVIQRLQSTGLGRFLDDGDRRRYGLEFTDNRYGDAVFLLDPGCLITPSFMESPYVPFFEGTVKAMHGYAPEHPSTRAVFLYHGPLELPYYPARVTDVAEVIERLVQS